MSRIRLGKIGSLLGLLAILTSVFAPTISQTLATHHLHGHAHTAFCTTDPASGAHTRDTPNHSLAQHWQACAYCGLLAHVPVLPGTAAKFGVAPAIACVSAAPSVRDVHALVAHTAAQPRAPPVFY
ncbi:DUF2946 domain-containing protein [Paraburkholderia dinghuensis]|uniref:DUF2946 domain-containing protein n=1 Tax=Paraburkholderia dinghuensis TaxID=2305225 RepID=A0A3N6MLV7_9BURK|nr:DUF2946 domain-containing protein [Paraburkholderia dinghuensis]RQH04478.1 DUF2946 domain-containing protein [Paraburkholderia dinghuensis]